MRKVLIKILSIILIIAVILEISYISISKSIENQTIKKSIKEEFMTGLMYDKNGNKSEIFNTILRLTKLNEETVKKLLENETANNIITDLVDSVYEYNITKDESVKYTGNQIVTIVNDNIDQVLREIDYPITEKERNDVIQYTKDHTKYIKS